MSKSYADQLRDAQFRKDVKGASWDELHQMADGIRDQLAKLSFMLVEINHDVEAAGTRNAEYTALSNGTMRDLDTMASEFANLYAKHEHRTGKARDGADYTEYMSIGMNYSDLNSNVQQVIGNATFALVEHRNNALEVLRQRAVAEAESEAVQAEAAPAAEQPAASEQA